jgi:hypothetical protein
MYSCSHKCAESNDQSLMVLMFVFAFKVDVFHPKVYIKHIG